MKRIGKNETTEMAPVKKCFVGLETALYLLFLALDAFSTGGDGVKYLTIVVCLLAVWVFVAAAGLLLAGAVVCRLRRQRLPRLGGRTPGFWAACGLGGLFLLIALLAALDFDGAFTVFHSIFFPGKDNWLFDPVTDPVILILPEAFFRNCAIAIVTVLLTVCIMLVVTGRKRPSCRSAPGEGAAS